MFCVAQGPREAPLCGQHCSGSWVNSAVKFGGAMDLAPCHTLKLSAEILFLSVLFFCVLHGFACFLTEFVKNVQVKLCPLPESYHPPKKKPGWFAQCVFLRSTHTLNSSIGRLGNPLRMN